MTAPVVADDAAGRARAIEVLRAGGVVALPTDTVYGIAVGLGTHAGIERLFAAKRRPLDKGIMLLLEDASQAAAAGSMTPAATALAEAFWPGGLTVVVPQRADVPWPSALTSGSTISALEALSQAIWPGNWCTSATIITLRVRAAAPHTPRSRRMRTQAGLPWKGPTTSSFPSKK